MSVPAIKTEPVILPFDFDEDLLEEVRQTGHPGLKIYAFSHRAVVAGRGSRLDSELNLDRIYTEDIRVYRRRGGGCAVYLDPGNLIVSIAFPARGFGNVSSLFNAAGGRLIKGLERAGIEGIYQDGISDLVVKNRKVGGSCFYRSRDLAYYSAALLVNADLGAMEAYLPHPPREPDYRQGRSHREFVAGLDELFPTLEISGLERALTESVDVSRLGAVDFPHEMTR